LLDVSHEIRTPLTRMKLSLEFIPESRRTEALKEEIRLLDTMLTEVLENERLSSLHGALQPRYQSLEPMLQRCIQRFSVAGIRIEHSLEDVSASYDEARMAIAIQNLLENAVRHTDPQNRSISLDLQRDGDTAIITIQDNGTGIPEKEKDRIFEPFYRKAAKPSEKPIQESGSSAGFGLGLSLVHRIVESHGGTIQLESSTDHGSKFTIRIPLTRSRAE
ncbi:MAG TPA: hypothetical protein DEA96_00225, partial [Leptospiraceae bacterium]|nr:hypothetical protein [Leptospiraceae bacterium]